MKTDVYVPGVCNIGPAEIRRRRASGWLGTGLAVAFIAVALARDWSPEWRLLVFLVPGVILLTCAAAHSLIAANPKTRLTLGTAFGIVIGWQLMFCLESQRPTYSRFTAEDVTKSIENLDGPNNEEYLSHLVLHPPAISKFITLNGCTSNTPLPEETPHLGRYALWVFPQKNCVVEFNQFCTPLLGVVASRGTVGCSDRGLLTVKIDNGPPVYVRIQRRALLSAIREAIRSRREG